MMMVLSFLVLGKPSGMRKWIPTPNNKEAPPSGEKKKFVCYLWLI